MATAKDNVNVQQKDIDNAKRVPDWIQYTFLKAADAFKYNCAWGFITEAEVKEKDGDFSKVADSIKKGVGTQILLNKVSNGYVFELPRNMMPTVLKTVIPDCPNEAINNYMNGNQEVQEQDKQRCINYLKKRISKSTTDDIIKHPKSGVNYVPFGLYCTNATNAIIDNDKTYKAYKMSLPTFMQLVKANGFQNKVGVIDNRTGAPLALNDERVGQQLKIADSKNGIVLNLAIF